MNAKKQDNENNRQQINLLKNMTLYITILSCKTDAQTFPISLLHFLKDIPIVAYSHNLSNFLCGKPVKIAIFWLILAKNH